MLLLQEFDFRNNRFGNAICPFWLIKLYCDNWNISGWPHLQGIVVQ